MNGKQRAVPTALEEDGKSRTINVVVGPAWLARVNEWRRQQPDLPNMSDAIRRLVDQALKAEE